jgi:hypothetical protein
MRAIAVDEFKGEPRLVEVAQPVPRPGQLLVKIAATALNPRARIGIECVDRGRDGWSWIVRDTTRGQQRVACAGARGRADERPRPIASGPHVASVRDPSSRGGAPMLSSHAPRMTAGCTKGGTT